jgi:hypothetical protein
MTDKRPLYAGIHHAAAPAPIPAAGIDCCETRKQVLECKSKSTQDLALNIEARRKG